MLSPLLTSKKPLIPSTGKSCLQFFYTMGFQKLYIVNAISVLYKNSKSAVMVDGGLSDPFDITTGVLQGDVLAPFLICCAG